MYIYLAIVNHGIFAGISHSADFQLRDLGIFDGETDFMAAFNFCGSSGHRHVPSYRQIYLFLERHGPLLQKHSWIRSFIRCLLM